MNNENLLKESQELFKIKPISINHLKGSIYSETYLKISNELNISNVRAILWHVINNVYEIPKCMICGKNSKYSHHINSYQIHCSKECKSNDPNINEYKKTIVEKREKTMMEKYGVAKISHLPEIRKKAADTMEARYGSRNTLQSSELKAKVQATNLERYGHTNVGPSTRKKASSTMTEKYGVQHTLQSSELKAKVQATNLERYGAVSPTMNSLIKEKIKQTNLVKYGRETIHQIHISDQSMTILSDKELYSAFVRGKSYLTVRNELNVSLCTVHNYAKKYQVEDLFSQADYNSYETIIKDILDQNNISYEHNNKSVLDGKHLDFYIPNHKLAIEVGSIYYHTEIKYNRGKTYHLDKWIKCQDQNITLLQYFDQELFEYPHLVESKIKRSCNLAVPIIGARKCQIQIITPTQEREFLNHWHLQGHMNRRNWSMGAYYNEELIAVMSIYYKNNLAKIERWSTNTNYSYPGLFSRMLSAFQKETNFTGQLVTFSNNMYGNGAVYESSGFTKSETDKIKPGYCYYKDDKKYSRIKFQKHKLAQLFGLDPNYVLEQGEFKIMEQQGYDRFWDAGHTNWIKNI